MYIVCKYSFQICHPKIMTKSRGQFYYFSALIWIASMFFSSSLLPWGIVLQSKCTTARTVNILIPTRYSLEKIFQISRQIYVNGMYLCKCFSWWIYGQQIDLQFEVPCLILPSTGGPRLLRFQLVQSPVQWKLKMVKINLLFGAKQNSLRCLQVCRFQEYDIIFQWASMN